MEVVDASAFVEIEKANQNPSLLTKIFLEKEIYLNEEQEFKGAFRYIDHMFDQDSLGEGLGRDDDLELLLGNQKFRQFFLSPKKVEHYKQNHWQDEYDDFGDKLRYLLPQFSERGPNYHGGERIRVVNSLPLMRDFAYGVGGDDMRENA